MTRNSRHPAVALIAATLLTCSLRAQTADSAPANRAMASPLDSPPFPASDWLSTVVIGEPDATPDYPLQSAIFGSSLSKSRIKVYGWIDVSGNLSRATNSNAPMSFDVVPNAFEMQQVILRFDRAPNTVQTEHTDWGFRFTNLYGVDYRYTTAKGWLSDQLLEHNELYGYDPVELYGVLYLPHVAQGMILRVGRYGSPVDIEDPFSPDNYLLSHSLVFSAGPSSFTGAQATVRLSPQWSLVVGLDAGGDMAPWSNSAQLNAELLARWVSPSNDDALWGGVNSIGNGRFTNGHDNLQQVVAVWGHRFNAKLHMQTEALYLWQFDADLGGSCNDGPVKPYGGGGGCGPLIPGRSEAVGALNYFEILLSPRDYLSVRTDWLNDVQGQRTGFATPYVEGSVGWAHWLTGLILVRPEIRYDRAFKATPYDNGTRANLLSAAFDLMVRF